LPNVRSVLKPKNTFHNTRRRVGIYLIPEQDNDVLTQLIKMLELCKSLSKEWQEVISGFLNNSDSTPIVDKRVPVMVKVRKIIQQHYPASPIEKWQYANLVAL
jgi:hypothetical protein